MMFRYVFFFALLLVYIIMLTDVLPTGQVSTSVECFVLLMLRYKFIIVLIKPLVRIHTHVSELLLTCKCYTSVHVVFL